MRTHAHTRAPRTLLLTNIYQNAMQNISNQTQAMTDAANERVDVAMAAVNNVTMNVTTLSGTGRMCM